MPKKLLLTGAILVVVVLIYRTFSFSPELVSFSGPTMGTTYTIKLYTNENIRSVSFIKDDVDAVLKQVNKSMSTYDPASELSLFNQAEINTAYEISNGLADVVKQALIVSKESNGAYDVTVGPLINLWGFGPNKQRERVPSEDEINLAKANVGYKFLNLEESFLSKSQDVYVDLSSIAKGYGIDQIAKKLNEFGVESYLVEIGGEIVAKGVKEDGSAWRIGIEKPGGRHNVAQRVVLLNDVAVATSGDYRNYFEKEGVRYSHLINPKSGKPITHRLVSVTVVAETATLADSYATAINVLGPEEGLVFAENNELAIYMLVKTDLGFVEKYSSKFEPYLVTP